MKHCFTLLFILMIFSQAEGQVNNTQTISLLASKYYQSRDFEKAAPLFKELYDASGNSYYFRLYIQSQIEMQQFEEANEEIRKEIRRGKLPLTDLLIQQGYILKMQKRPEESLAKYNEALRNIAKNRNSVVTTASNFMQWREYEMAEKAYLSGKEMLPQEKFNNELAQIYLYLRNYERMTEELFDLARQSEQNLPVVESLLASALYSDIDEGFRDEFRTLILKRIQAEPSTLAYNRLFIWFLLQERQFTAALRQVMALDRRTRQEDMQILNLAQMAINNQNYAEAGEAYSYVISKGRDNPAWAMATSQKLHSDYLHFTNSGEGKDKAAALAGQFEEGLAILGHSVQNLYLIREYAHLLSFYLRNSDKAIELLQKGLELPLLKPNQAGELKTEMADVFVYAGDPYEATLLYSQVIDANRDNALGDEVKLKKAKLAYYLGNFDYARAQLDVLKASTSKLTANDAMELSLFISDNSVVDTTMLSLKYFAEADLLFFRNEDALALQKLDSIEVLFPQNSLYDDILFRKAKIAQRKNDADEVIRCLEMIVSDYPEELICDDALFMLAETWQFKKQDPAKSAEIYKKILFEYPGSIYVTEARNRFRELGGDKTRNPAPENEKTFFDGKTNQGN